MKRPLHDGVLHGPESGSRTRGNVDLVIDVLDAGVGSFGRDEEAVGNLRNSQPASREREYFDFAAGKDAIRVELEAMAWRDGLKQ